MAARSASASSTFALSSSPGIMRWGWMSLLVIVLEVYLWTKPGDQSFVKALRFHLYAFSVFGLYFASRYIWRRMRQLIRPLPLLAQYPLLAILLVGLSLATITIPLGQLIVLTEPPLFLLLGSYFVGVVIFLSGALLGLNVTASVMRRLIRRRDNSKIDNGESKDASLRLQSLIALLITLVLLSIGGYHSRNIQISYVTIPISGLPRNLNGTTIVQLSDIHMGPFIGRSHIEAVVKRANGLNGDIIVITGDLIDSSVENLWEAAKPLGELKTKLGVYYTTGNHEYYSGDVDSWIERLPELHVTPLINERRCIEPLMKEGATTEGNGRDESNCQNGFYLAGLEDIETRRLRYGHHSMDIHKALSGRTQKIPTIVLAHQPRAAAEAIHWKDVRLVLSGHTHAGQVLPLMLPIYLYNPYFAGLYQPMVGVYVYVSAGTHYYMLPYRHYKPEITLLTLVSV